MKVQCTQLIRIPSKGLYGGYIYIHTYICICIDIHQKQEEQYHLISPEIVQTEGNRGGGGDHRWASSELHGGKRHLVEQLRLHALGLRDFQKPKP